MNDVGPLDPRQGPPIAFRRVGKRWFLGNRPARIASEIIEENGRVTIAEFGAAGEIVETEILRETKAA